uniref:Uncharacterized protein n=1 Tax=uncultured Dehalococcoidia bacterium TaxID=498747 RepID=A0A871Y7N0_9CHLR|nr:hypothetical protein HULAa30F3_00013 [uncultured Dehalococcoidia bacterium]
MIIVRRFFAVLLAILLVVLFVPLMLVSQVNNTVANPNFYTDQLRKADMYNFVSAQILPAMIEQVDTSSGAASNLDWAKPQLTQIAQQSVPPAWLQFTTEQAINAVIPYMAGDADHFTITIQLKDRVPATAQAIKTALADPVFFNRIYNESLVDVLVSAVEGQDLPLPLTSTELESLILQICPPDWVRTQLNATVDSLSGYLTGTQSAVSIRINLMERMAAAQTAVTDVMKKQALYDYMMDKVVAPAVQAQLGTAALPYGITLTSTEVSTIVKQSLPLSWYQGQVSSVVSQIFGYFKGTTNSLALSVSVADRKSAVINAVSQTADTKLEAMINKLPTVPPAQFATMIVNLPANTLPAARPAGVSYADIKTQLKINISDLVTPIVNQAVPDQFTIPDKTVREAFGGTATGGSDPLTQARQYVMNGYVISSDQFASSPDISQSLVDMRDKVNKGFTLTDADMTTSEPTDMLDMSVVRDSFLEARPWMFLTWLIPLLLILAIGFLGGRDWGSRLLWAGVPLLICGILSAIVSGPVAAIASNEAIKQLPSNMFADSGLSLQLQSLLDAKVTALVQTTISSFFSGLLITSIVIAVASIAAIVGGAILHARRKQGAAS